MNNSPIGQWTALYVVDPMPPSRPIGTGRIFAFMFMGVCSVLIGLPFMG